MTHNEMEDEIIVVSDHVEIHPSLNGGWWHVVRDGAVVGTYASLAETRRFAQCTADQDEIREFVESHEDDDEKRAAIEHISDEADAAKEPLKIYHCDDCGGRIAAQILNGPTEPMPHHYLAASGGEAFLGCCPICGGTMFHDLSLDLGQKHTADSTVPEHS